MSIKGFKVNGEIHRYDYESLDNKPSQSGSGLTDEIKQALLACFENVAWINADGQTYYDALAEALNGSGTVYYSVTNNLTGCTTSNGASRVAEGDGYTAKLSTASDYMLTSVKITMGGDDVTNVSYSGGTISIPNVTGDIVIMAVATQRVANLTSISAVFTQGGNTIYDTDSLDSLKQYLVVTATYDDSSTATVASNDYTLSGTLTEGTSTITVSYGGKTDTFIVSVTHSSLLYKWDFTKSLVDEVNGAEATLLGKVERTSGGLSFDNSISNNKTGASAYLGHINMIGKTIEIDVASMEFSGNSNKHVRLLMNARSDDDTSNNDGFGSVIYRSSTKIGWAAYGYTGETASTKAWSNNLWNANLGINSFSGKTVKVVYGDDGHTTTLYVDDVQMGVITDVYFNSPRSDYLYIGGASNAIQDYGDQLFNAVISGVRIYPNAS